MIRFEKRPYLVLKYLKDYPQGKYNYQITREFKFKPTDTSYVIHKLLIAGLVNKLGFGRYVINELGFKALKEAEENQNDIVAR